MATMLRERNGVASRLGERDLQGDGEVKSRDLLRSEPETEVAEVRTGCIGRGHAGKTALFRALSEGPVGDFFPSGLHVDVGDPKEVAAMIREAEETQRILQASGLPPTLDAAQMRYYLYDGDQQCVVYRMREVIGQVLTHTLPDSAPEQQARYDDYLKTLVNTHVLWAVIPCPPPNPSSRDRRRYSNDLRITGAYLREALRRRTMNQPAAVALILSKIDSLFKDEDEARATLTDDMLRSVLGPLVQLIHKSSHVGDAVALPVTAFGFGNAVRSESNGSAPSYEDPFGAEPTWLLRDDANSQPFNLDTLVIWTLLLGLVNQDNDRGLDNRMDVSRLSQMLHDDLLMEDRWFLPLKGKLAHA